MNSTKIVLEANKHKVTTQNTDDHNKPLEQSLCVGNNGGIQDGAILTLVNELLFGRTCMHYEPKIAWVFESRR